MRSQTNQTRFPLPPARHSADRRREEKIRATADFLSTRPPKTKRPRPLFPLPGGEGQGEGGLPVPNSAFRTPHFTSPSLAEPLMGCSLKADLRLSLPSELN